MGDAVLVVAEMLTIPESLIEAVRSRLPNVRFAIWATHTHCAPDSQMLNARMTVPVPGIATFSRKWMNWYADRIAEAIRLAPSVEGKLEVRLSTVPLAKGRRPSAAPDTRFWQVTVDGRPWLGIYGAHPTLHGSSERTLQGDWPGEWMRQTSGLMLCGPIGDVAPVGPLSSAPAKEQSVAFARALQQAPSRRVSSPQELILRQQRVENLPAVSPHQEFATSNKITPALAASVVQKFAPTEATLTQVVMGDTLLLGIPGEPTAGVARRLERVGRQAGYRHVIVTSHGGGWLGYILTPDDYRRGGYEANLAFHGPDLSVVLEREVQAMLGQR